METKAIYGYGYFIDPEMSRSLDDEKFEELISTPYAMHINGYSMDDWTGIFFGFIYGNAEVGEIMEIPEDYDYAMGHFEEMVEKYRYFFPKADDFPREYLINTCL